MTDRPSEPNKVPFGSTPRESSDGPAPSMPPIIRFNDLPLRQDEVWIEHHGQLYRLRRTKQNRLILTK